MSTCAQNQSNQDEDGPGADANEGNSHHETAAQHFLSTSQSSNGAASRTNGFSTADQLTVVSHLENH